jgi:hypothetical protein
MDKDHDNRLGDNDFSASVREDPLLLSCFGQVFANARVSIQTQKKKKLNKIFSSDSRSISTFFL